MQAPAAPADGDRLVLADVNGALLHITVLEIVHDIETAFGLSDAIQVDIAVLDGPHKGEELEKVLIFPRVLQSQLSKFAGTVDPVVLGRLGQGEAKPGKSAPWVLKEATPGDIAIGEKYEAYIAQRRANVEEPF